MGVSRDCPIFWVPPIISGTGKATDFKFGGYIYRVNLNKSLLKIFEKRERGRIQGLSNFFGYPLLSQEQIKLRISNLVRTFRGSILGSPSVAYFILFIFYLFSYWLTLC